MDAGLGVTTTEEGTQEGAFRALSEFIRRSTVFLMPAGAPTTLGSGTLLKAASGELFVLTAAHVLVDDPAMANVRIGYADCANTATAFRAEVIRNPRAGSDVALLRVPDEHTSLLTEYACDVERLATQEPRWGALDHVQICGFPSAMTQQLVSGPQSKTLLTRSILYRAETSSFRREPDGRGALNWSTAEHERTGTRQELPLPYGMSGCGLWRYADAQETGPIWSAGQHLSLVGVQVAWREDERILLVELASDWGPWAATVLGTR